MWIKKPIFKIIAPILAISLIMVGVIPASSACDGICDCCIGSSDTDHSLMVISKDIQWDQNYVSVPGLSPDGHRSHSSFNTSPQDPNCHQGLETASCDMDQTRPSEFIQGPGPNVSRAERFAFNSYVVINPDIFHSSSTFTEVLSRQSSMARAAPVPIYVLTLTFLC